jgi:hypothetical protein
MQRSRPGSALTIEAPRRQRMIHGARRSAPLLTSKGVISMRKRQTIFLGLLVAVALLAGCFPGANPGVAVSGRVTYQGKPVDDAMIFFRVDFEKTGRSSSAYISGGRYSIPADRGPFPGEFNVEIVSISKPTPTGNQVTPDAGSPSIPEKYNKYTELRVVIPPRKEYELLFDL